MCLFFCISPFFPFQNSTLRLEMELAEKKLSIRNDRIENLKAGLKEEKRHLKDVQEQFSAERERYRADVARYREELVCIGMGRHKRSPLACKYALNDDNHRHARAYTHGNETADWTPFYSILIRSNPF